MEEQVEHDKVEASKGSDWCVNVLHDIDWETAQSTRNGVIDVVDGLVPRDWVAFRENKLGVRVKLDELVNEELGNLYNGLIFFFLKIPGRLAVRCLVHAAGRKAGTYIIIGEPLVEIGLVVRLAFAIVLVAQSFLEQAHMSYTSIDTFVHVIRLHAKHFKRLIHRKGADTN